MAIKDPNARRSAVHYPKGRVIGCIGLLKEIFGEGDLPNPAEIKVSSNGRRRLVNLINKTSAIGGKQIVIEMKTGQTYTLHYAGTLVDFRLGAVPKMDRNKVLSFSTKRGKKQYL